MLIKNYRLYSSNNLSEIVESYNILKNYNNFYPDFENWYWNKFIPSIYLGEGRLILLKNKYEILGVSLLKKSNLENKLRALRIHPKFENKGSKIILNLIDFSFKELGDDFPTFTIPEEIIGPLGRIFVNRYNSKLSKIENGLYRKGKYEYVFNEKINQRIKTWY
jgi:hypothetical protein